MNINDEQIITELRESVRNRLAHTFLTDGHVVVHKKDLLYPIETDPDKILLKIDASKLFEEFKVAVIELKIGLDASNKFRDNFINRLKTMKDTYSIKLNKKNTFNLPANTNVHSIPPSGVYFISSQTTTVPLKSQTLDEAEK